MAEARTKRRLTAILAMDVVGYSRMVEADEAEIGRASCRERVYVLV